MKANKAAMMVCAALSLSGCAGIAQAYRSPVGVTSAEREQTLDECVARVDAMPILAVEDENWTLFGRARNGLVASCMEARGYRLTPNFESAL